MVVLLNVPVRDLGDTLGEVGVHKYSTMGVRVKHESAIGQAKEEGGVVAE